MTAAQYFQMPEGPPFFQLIDGELFMSPSPSFFHQKLALRIATALENYLEQHPLGEVQIAPSDVHLDGGNVFQPDIYYVGHERLSIIGPQGAAGAPDLVVEIISASTGRLDLGPKKTIYTQSGVQELWAVFPARGAIEIYEAGNGMAEPVHTLSGNDTLTSSLFPEFSLSLAKLFNATVRA